MLRIDRKARVKKELTPPPPLVTLIASPRRISRIAKAVEEHGVEKLSAAILSHLTPERGTEKVKSVREVGAELGMSKNKVQRILSDLPLRDISNTSHTHQRAELRDILLHPAASVLPTYQPESKSYLSLIEEDLLLKMITDRAVNEDAVGQSAIRGMARDLRRARKTSETVELPSQTWFKEFRRRHKEQFKVRKAGRKEYKRADAERHDEIKAWYDVLKGHYHAHGFKPHEIFAMDEIGLAGRRVSTRRSWSLLGIKP